MSLTWLESRAARFLVVPRTALAHWSGTEGDYDQACAVMGTEWSPRALPDGAEALVLGDEPLSTAYLPEYRVLVPLVLRGERGWCRRLHPGWASHRRVGGRTCTEHHWRARDVRCRPLRHRGRDTHGQHRSRTRRWPLPGGLGKHRTRPPDVLSRPPICRAGLTRRCKDPGASLLRVTEAGSSWSRVRIRLARRAAF